MTEIHAKPIVDGKFWIVEENGTKVATLHKKENNKYMLSSTNGEMMFNKKQDLTKQFGEEFSLPVKSKSYRQYRSIRMSRIPHWFKTLQRYV